jgi:hypothetical protein
MKAQVLLPGTVLTPGRRTVTSAPRVTGLSDDRTFANYEPAPKFLNLVDRCPTLIVGHALKLSPMSWWGGLGDGRRTTRRPMGTN